MNTAIYVSTPCPPQPLKYNKMEKKLNFRKWTMQALILYDIDNPSEN